MDRDGYITRKTDDLLTSINTSKDNFDNLVKDFSSKVNELTELEKRVENKKKELEEENHLLNFQGLASSFQNIYNNKIKEKDKLRWALIAFSTLILLPILYTLYLDGLIPFLPTITHSPIFNFTSTQWTFYSLFKIIPLGALEAIFIYYFRIILQNYASVKYQLLQLKYRATVAEFANNYIKFLNEKNPEEKLNFLSKFEALIFNDISPDTKNIPTPLGAFEPLIKAFKNTNP